MNWEGGGAVGNNRAAGSGAVEGIKDELDGDGEEKKAGRGRVGLEPCCLCR